MSEPARRCCIKYDAAVWAQAVDVGRVVHAIARIRPVPFAPAMRRVAASWTTVQACGTPFKESLWKGKPKVVSARGVRVEGTPVSIVKRVDAGPLYDLSRDIPRVEEAGKVRRSRGVIAPRAAVAPMPGIVLLF